MLLVLDIGNTNIGLGVYKEKDMLINWVLSTDEHKTVDEYGAILLGLFRYSHIDIKGVKCIICASVVPDLTPVFSNLSRKYFKSEALIVDSDTPGLKPILCDNPQEVGADRIVNSIAAFTLYGGPCIVVDFGTATTFDIINKKGEYLGGVIAPGVMISTDALFQRTAKLPWVEVVKPERVVGKNTVESIQSGLFYGFVGQVKGILENIQKENKSNWHIVATGGIAPLIAFEIETIEVINQNLTLQGLQIIWDNIHNNIR